MTPRHLVAGIAVVLLAVGAWAFAAARDPEYRAVVDLTAAPRGVLSPTISPIYLRRLLSRGESDLRIRLERSGMDPGTVDTVVIRGGAFRPFVRVSSAAGTPARAENLLTQVVRQLDALSAAELTRRARGVLRATQATLTDPLLDVTERDRLERRARSVRRYLRAPRGRFGAGPVRVQQPTRWADRVVDALPGPFPQRPDPLWAALVGLLVGGSAVATTALWKRRPEWLERLS
jgi:hypothetical protein